MMRTFLRVVDDFLRGRGVFAPGTALSRRLLWLFILLMSCGFFYGVVMGTYSGLTPGRFHQLLYCGLKVPLLLLATCLLCLPSFFVLNTVAGVREDFGEALRAIVATQSCITVVLAALAPITAFWYVSCSGYQPAVLFNGLMFGVATITAQVVVRRYYRLLINRSPRHRQLLWAWFLLYAFVGIQMGWVLRPFIGDPDMPVSFFRSGAWGNAYVAVGRLITETVHSQGFPLVLLWLAALAGLGALVIIFRRILTPHPRSGG